MKKVFVGNSKFAGKGIFARRNIKKGEILFIVKGIPKVFIVKNKKDSLQGDRWIAIGKNRWLDPLPNNPWFFINHSCNPNAGIKGFVTLRAMRNIKANEEITIDYSSNEVDSGWSMKCACGYKYCRKNIHGALSTNKLVIKKYLPFVSNFVRKSLSL